MWAEAAKAMAKYPEGVLNAVDARGFPFSVRQLTLPFETATGTMPVVLPDALGAVAGPASLLCHFHDEKLWNLRAIQLRGRIEKGEVGWRFVATAFTPPAGWRTIPNMRQTAMKYLAERGLPLPKVDFDAIGRLWTRARQIKNP
jgi:hypothetical protein